MNIPRDVLASPMDISITWRNLSELLHNVHEDYRNEFLARLVISVRVGLFPSAVNEIWNLTIIALQDRIRFFGFNEAKYFLKKDFDEKILRDLKDHELLDICVKLGVLSERDYFFLMHCKETRNNFSSAHPSEYMLDGHELTAFINSCVKYVLSKREENVGINIHSFIHTMKGSKLKADDITELSEKIKNAFDIQRNGLLTALFGIFCDPLSDEHTRFNCQAVLQGTWDSFSSYAISEILSTYGDYSVSDTKRRDLARELFKNLGKLEILPKEEQFQIIQRTLKALEAAHHGRDNFYTEVPLAENLSLFHKQVPSQLNELYVYVVSLCYVGNQYGTSIEALKSYQKMVQNFTREQIDALVHVYRSNNYLRHSIRSFERCRKMMVSLAEELPARNISPKSKVEIDAIKKKHFK